MIDVMYSSIEPISVQISELIDLQLQLAREEYELAQERYLTQAAVFFGSGHSRVDGLDLVIVL